jgi:nucleotide-binding universal stress UspA family protein
VDEICIREVDIISHPKSQHETSGVIEMIRIKRILLPTDFSDCANQARDYACLLAEQLGAELHLLHVLSDPLQSAPAFGMGLVSPELLKRSDEDHRKLEAAARGKLNATLNEDWKAGKEVACRICWGNPFVEIVRDAREHEVDLIVMGTHGRSGLSHALLGSIAENVVRHAPCPVLTVRPEGHQFVLP